MEGNPCSLLIKSEWVKAEYLGLFQYSDVIPPSPMIGGHHGGVIAHPVAVVKYEGKLMQVDLGRVKLIEEER